jgi:acyl-CoA thioesterase
MTEPADAESVAAAVGRFIEERDSLARHLGIGLEAVGPGYARVSGTIGPEMTNHSGIGHGGAIFTVADTAFGYACNTSNANAVAVNCSISYLAAVGVGDVLTAEAREVYLEGRNGVCDITVSNQEGQVVALFRGHARRVRGTVVPDLPEGE